MGRSHETAAVPPADAPPHSARQVARQTAVAHARVAADLVAADRGLGTHNAGASVVPRIQQLVRDVLRPEDPGETPRTVVLAVSGGIDSMVLLDAAAATLDPAHLLVATFDHATGPFATTAVDAVATAAERYGVRFVTARLPSTPDDSRRRMGDGQEAAWRRARWEFLRGVAGTAGPGAVVATAHTRDDQIETVFMRVLRDAGPRGLAALYAPSPILRPLLAIHRTEIERYAFERRITFVSDPSNAERTYLRNRIRHDLLPAILGQRPGFAEELLTLSRRAAEWRARMDAIAATFTVMTDATGSCHIPRAQFAGLPADALRVVWPALAARGGVVMDWRGTHRLATFTIEGEPGQSIQLSGGFEVVMRRESMVLRRWRRHG